MPDSPPSNLHPRLQNAIQERLDQAVASGAELGVQCVIWHDGAIRASCHAGYCDVGRQKPLDSQSLFPVFSTGKALFSTLALRLVERGILGLDMPLAEVWPEFGQGERRHVKLRHILNHTSGMHIMPQPANPQEFCDWEYMCRRVAERQPVWMPGTRTRYQALNYSWLLGGTLEHATGKPLPELFQEELLRPAGISQEVFFGIPETEEWRLGTIVNGPDLQALLPPHQNFLDPLTNAFRLRRIRAACLPAFNCIACAAGLAQFGAALLRGEFLSPALLREATSLQRPADEPIPSENLDEYWTIFGLGYLLMGAPPDRGRLFGHQGHGGSELLIDQERGIVYAVVKNLLSAKVLQPMQCEIHRLAEQILK